MNELQSFENQAPAQRTTQTEMMISRQTQEVQAAMVIAKRFPRDQVTAYNKVMNGDVELITMVNALTDTDTENGRRSSKRITELRNRGTTQALPGRSTIPITKHTGRVKPHEICQTAWHESAVLILIVPYGKLSKK
ncbi:MAG: hypothetical protein LIO94_04745 [Clostridiales bacterium]|nr:hypothetical protein [Clostridiales bacterium]